MADDRQKVKDTNGVYSTGSVQYDSVSMVDCLGGAPPKAFIELSKPQRETPYFYPDSMKADSSKLRDAYTSFTHLQAPRSPFSSTHWEQNWPNIDLKYWVE